MDGIALSMKVENGIGGTIFGVLRSNLVENRIGFFCSGSAGVKGKDEVESEPAVVVIYHHCCRRPSLVLGVFLHFL